MKVYPHGYTRYKLNGCLCNICGFAASEYTRIRKERIAAGTWRHDTGPLREHIRVLRAAGIGTRRLAVLSGVNRPVLEYILRGRASQGTPPPKTVRYDIGEAILAVSPNLAAAAAGRDLEGQL